MTRRQVLAETLKLTGLLWGGIGLLAGCEGGGNTETNQAQVSAEQKAEQEKQKAATEAFYKEKMKKK